MFALVYVVKDRETLQIQNRVGNTSSKAFATEDATSLWVSVGKRGGMHTDTKSDMLA